MSKTIRVFIGGKDYSLKGEDEEIVRQSADELDEQVGTLKKKHINESDLTLTVLAALNITEEKIREKNQIEIDKKFVASEINNMAEFLNDSILKNN